MPFRGVVERCPGKGYRKVCIQNYGKENQVTLDGYSTGQGVQIQTGGTASIPVQTTSTRYPVTRTAIQLRGS